MTTMLPIPTSPALAGPPAAPTATATPLLRVLAPVFAIVFLEFLAMGLPLGVLPAHVHGVLGYGSLVVGLAIGAQSAATLLTRHRAGTRSDARGPRHAMLAGLLLSAIAGVVLALSGALAGAGASLAVLLAARALLGLGESLVVTGALAYGVALAGRERTGVVMAWVGIAMYGALAAGSPVAAAVHAEGGFVGVALAAALAPTLALVTAPWLRHVPPSGGTRLAWHRVLGMIGRAGLGLSLAAVGFGAIAGFATLHFAARGWPSASQAMTAFGLAYVLARLLGGSLPDRFGGARVAVASAAVTALGQLALWLADSPALAIAAAALSGLGFSLAFPSFGVEAMRGVAPQHRGVALGAYAACFDATMAVLVPLVGLAVGSLGAGAAFAIGAIAAVGALAIALSLLRRRG